MSARRARRLPAKAEYLSRPLSREETAKFSPAAMKARRLAQTRACRHGQKMAAELDKVARHDAYKRRAVTSSTFRRSSSTPRLD